MRTNKILNKIDSKQIKNNTSFSSGDTVIVSVKVKEGKRERIQQFEGVVISKKNKGINCSFSTRLNSSKLAFSRSINIKFFSACMKLKILNLFIKKIA